MGVAVIGLALASSSPAIAAKPPDCHRNAPPVIHDGFHQPPARYSRNGVLDTRLRAAIGPVQINGQQAITGNYEGSFPGPTLVLCAGDKLKVHFQNDLLDPTNLHVHGFHVSPKANHDNVYLNLMPGQAFNYEYSIPRDHSPGSYWYHPHHHMYVERQLFAGLAGAIVMEGGLDRLPSLRHVPQRWMFIQSTEVVNGRVLPVDDSIEANTPLLVNGVVNPTVKIRPGQLQRWRIFNANDNRIVVLRLDSQSFTDLAHDGNTLDRMRTVNTLLIPPGSRREVLVRGGPAGTTVMRALPFAQFPGGNTAAAGGPTPNQAVVTLKSAGRRVKVPTPRRKLGGQVDLRHKHVDRRRTIVFNEQEVGQNTNFLLNGQTFDPNRALTMKLNSLEEWKLVNRNTEWHTFHIHVNDFQVISVNGRARPFKDYEDNVALPPMSTVVIRMRPTDFTGKFVFHCHVTFHEDHGMMAAVQVLKKPTPAQLNASLARDGALTVSSAAYRSDRRPARATLPGFFCPLGTRHDLHAI
jgi:suppressor of ftsI